MIKNGMWFENEEHYAYFLSRCEPALVALYKFQRAILGSLIERVLSLLNKTQEKQDGA